MSRFNGSFRDRRSTDESSSSLDALFEALNEAIDTTEWKTRKNSQSIVVSSGVPSFFGQPSSVEGFHIETTIPQEIAVSLEQGVAYFRDACHFAETANAMTSKSEILWQEGDRAIVRTGFELPWPLQNREFLHGVAVKHGTSSSSSWIVYTTLSEEEESTLPPPWKGYLRCTMSPSGQRLTKLENGGGLKLEHCMTYPLGGSISSWVQNWVFHNGHVGAYFKEWKTMKAELSKECTQQKD